MTASTNLVHIVSTTQPTGLNLGDEWYNPTTNTLYKNLLVNGTTTLVNQLPASANSTSNISMPTGTGAAAVQGLSTNIASGNVTPSTSGTSIDFTGIPSWAKRITVIFNSVSTNGISNLVLRIGNGSFKAANFTTNRIVGESGTKNSDFAFISIEQIGRRKAVIGSYGAHATSMGADNMEFSADYPGYWQRKMEQETVDLAIFCGGSVGSQSPSGEGKGFEKPKNIGESLADSLKLYLPTVALKDKMELSSLTLKVDLPPYNIRLTTQTNFTTWVSKKLMPYPENVYLQTIKMGNLIWLTAPCDFSGEFALQLKNSLAAKGYNANVTSFNGSYVGYIIPGKYFYFDSYEPKTMGWFGPNMGEYTFELLRHLSEKITEPVKK